MRILVVIACIFALSGAVDAQQKQYTTPVPILKQINKHNDDGSYSYGYEGADGTFKIETKYPNGEVFGKYGYVDDQGKVREIEYGASRRGFEPQGSDINVPPPTLTNSHPYPLGPNEIDDGQYREDPSVYFKNQKFAKNTVPASRFQLNNLQGANQPQYNAPAPVQRPVAPVTPATYNPYYNPQPHRFQQQPSPPQQPYYNPPQPQPQPYYNQPPSSYYNGVNVPTQHHPALRNLNLYTGSYSIDYTGR